MYALRNDLCPLLIHFFSGPKLPFKLYKSMMVSLPLLNEIILFRGFRGQDHPNNSTPFNAMVRLNNISMKWTIYNQTFKYGRHSHVAFLIPERWQVLDHLKMHPKYLEKLWYCEFHSLITLTSNIEILHCSRKICCSYLKAR